MECGQDRSKVEKLLIWSNARCSLRKFHVIDWSKLACLQPPAPLRKNRRRGLFCYFFSGPEWAAVHRLQVKTRVIRSQVIEGHTIEFYSLHSVHAKNS